MPTTIPPVIVNTPTSGSNEVPTGPGPQVNTAGRSAAADLINSQAGQIADSGQASVFLRNAGSSAGNSGSPSVARNNGGTESALSSGRTFESPSGNKPSATTLSNGTTTTSSSSAASTQSSPVSNPSVSTTRTTERAESGLKPATTSNTSTSGRTNDGGQVISQRQTTIQPQNGQSAVQSRNAQPEANGFTVSQRPTTQPQGGQVLASREGVDLSKQGTSQAPVGESKQTFQSLRNDQPIRQETAAPQVKQQDVQQREVKFTQAPEQPTQVGVAKENTRVDNQQIKTLAQTGQPAKLERKTEDRELATSLAAKKAETEETENTKKKQGVDAEELVRERQAQEQGQGKKKQQEENRENDFEKNDHSIKNVVSTRGNAIDSMQSKAQALAEERDRIRAQHSVNGICFLTDSEIDRIIMEEQGIVAKSGIVTNDPSFVHEKSMDLANWIEKAIDPQTAKDAFSVDVLEKLPLEQLSVFANVPIPFGMIESLLETLKGKTSSLEEKKAIEEAIAFFKPISDQLAAGQVQLGQVLNDPAKAFETLKNLPATFQSFGSKVSALQQDFQATPPKMDKPELQGPVDQGCAGLGDLLSRMETVLKGFTEGCERLLAEAYRKADAALGKWKWLGPLLCFILVIVIIISIVLYVIPGAQPAAAAIQTLSGFAIAAIVAGAAAAVAMAIAGIIMAIPGMMFKSGGRLALQVLMGIATVAMAVMGVTAAVGAAITTAVNIALTVVTEVINAIMTAISTAQTVMEIQKEMKKFCADAEGYLKQFFTEGEIEKAKQCGLKI